MNHDKAKEETIKSFEESLKKYKLDLEKTQTVLSLLD